MSIFSQIGTRYGGWCDSPIGPRTERGQCVSVLLACVCCTFRIQYYDMLRMYTLFQRNIIVVRYQRVVVRTK